MKLGILKEGKNPPDKRVPFSPTQCAKLNEIEGLEVFVQSSEIRAYADEEYREQGVQVVQDISHCDVLMGVKEVPENDLIADKTYLFFSHTYKKQPYNRSLLNTILKKNIKLVDYELLTNKYGQRLVAFGRYAGIVGAYNALRGWGILQDSFALKPAHQCHDRSEMDAQLVQLPLHKNTKIVVTGKGRVAGGAVETLKNAGIRKVLPKEFLTEIFEEPVYTELGVSDYNKHKGKVDFLKREFYDSPEKFESNFMRFAKAADIYIACHYWDARAPFVFTREDARSQDFNLKLVADVSCDIDGPVASTLRPSTISNPFYGYCPDKETEVPFGERGSIGVMAVDNLPCELPRDASSYFGKELLQSVIPCLLGDDPDEVIWRATETKDGKLTPHFSYLQDFVDGK